MPSLREELIKESKEAAKLRAEDLLKDVTDFIKSKSCSLNNIHKYKVTYKNKESVNLVIMNFKKEGIYSYVESTKVAFGGDYYDEECLVINLEDDYETAKEKHKEAEKLKNKLLIAKKNKRNVVITLCIYIFFIIFLLIVLR